MNRYPWKTVIVVLASLMLMVLSACTNKEEEKARKAEMAMIVRGGLMFDNWAKTLGKVAPATTHHSYMNSGGKAQGAETWRCVECHGWDYQGKESDYSSGNRFSGFRGLRDVAGGDEFSVLTHIKAISHRFGEYITDEELKSLVAFVVKGQLDMTPHIDRGTRKAKGDPAAGEKVYRANCAFCHGDDGKKLKLGDGKNPQSLGAIATEDPWKTLHKIRFGQPGTEAPALLAAPVQQQVDVLAYMQTLPGN